MTDSIRQVFFTSPYAVLMSLGDLLYCLGAAFLARRIKLKRIGWYLRLIGLTVLSVTVLFIIEYAYAALTGNTQWAIYLSKPVAAVIVIIVLGSEGKAGRTLTAATYCAMYFSFLGISSFIGSAAGIPLLTILLFFLLMTVTVFFCFVMTHADFW